MDERIAHYENLLRESSTQNSNLLVTPTSKTSLRRTTTSLASSSSRELKPQPLSRKNAVSFREKGDFFNIIADKAASSRRKSEEHGRLFAKVVAKESAENEVELWQFQGKKGKGKREENADEALGLEDINQDGGNEHYVVETLREGADGPELNIVYYQVTRKTIMRGADFRDISGRQYSSQESTLSSATAKTDSGIELDRFSPRPSQSHDYESLYLEVPEIQTKADVKSKSSADQALTSPDSNIKTGSGIESSSPRSSNAMYHEYESVYLEVPGAATKAERKRKFSADLERTLSRSTAKANSESDRSSPRSSQFINHEDGSSCLDVPKIDSNAEVRRKTSEDQRLFHIVQELIDTEKSYLSILERIVNEYKPYLETHAPVGLQGKSKYIFGNILDIQRAVEEFLSCLLKKGLNNIEGIAQVFLDFSSMFELYPVYCANKPTAEYYLSQFKRISAEKQEELEDPLDLSSYMITPIQRIGRYILMLEDIQKQLRRQNQFSENIEKAVKIIKREMQKGNDSIAIQSIVFCAIDLTKYGSYIMRDQFKVKSSKRPRYEATVFLFDKILVLTQRSERSKNTDFEEFKYVDNMKIDNLFVRTRLEPTTIELLTKDDSQSCTLQAETSIVRNSWMERIEKMLKEQLVEAKAQHNVEIRTNVATPTLSRRSSQYYSSGSGDFEYDKFYDAIEDVPGDTKLPDNPSRAQASAILQGLKDRNTISAIDSIKKCPVDLSKEGQLEMSEAFSVLKPARYDGRIFLFEKIIVFTKIMGHNPEQYLHQASINVCNLGITSLEHDSPVFHLYDSEKLRKAQGEEWRFELEAKSADIKVLWTKKIERLLTQEQRRRSSASGRVSDDYVFVNQSDVKGLKIEKEEPDTMISRAIKNLISAEEKYVADLRVVVRDYEQYFEAHSSISGIIGKSSYLFGNVSSILKKAEEFVDSLRIQRKDDLDGILNVFMNMASMFELYPEHAKTKSKSDHYLKEIDFILKARQEELGDNTSLATHLSKPSQRLQQYLHWLEHVQNIFNLERKEPPSNLERAMGIVSKKKKEMDDCFAIDSIKDCLIERNKYGSFIMSGQFTVQKPIKYESTVYLFENVVVFTKNDPNNIKTYMDSIEMSALHMTPLPNEPLLFHLVNFPRLQTGLDRCTFVLKSKSPKVKDAWTSKIQNMLWEQLQLAKEKQDRVSGGAIVKRSTEVLRGTPPVVPVKSKVRYSHHH